MRRRAFYLIIILLVFVQIFMSTLISGQPLPIHIPGKDIIVVGYFDCWLHSDGITWQDTDGDGDRDKPGDGQVQLCDIIVDIPKELEKEFKNIYYKVNLFSNSISLSQKEDFFNRAGGIFTGLIKPDNIITRCDNFPSFDIKVLKYIPDNFELIEGSSNRVSFTFPEDKNYTLDITKEWQAEKVQGKRKLLPVLVEFYGTKKECPCQAKEPTILPCRESPSISNQWEEVYSIITGYGTSTVCSTSTWIDKDGKNHSETDCWEETDYSKKIWEDVLVTYNEKLDATVTINTKQGNPNGGRESRGAWEIIPWAKARGLDPNTVTRSGYGFEVKVDTKYRTDWETKIPQGLEDTALPKGGSLKGSDRVIAEFYDTRGRLIKQVQLEPTKGNTGDHDITWELPQVSLSLPDGSIVVERKHYTDVNVPDGKYRVRVIITDAGKTDLCLIQNKSVTIYKDMWEDSFTRPAKSEE